VIAHLSTALYKVRTVLNGSRLGKEFSANAFNDLFNETHNRPQHSPISTVSPISPVTPVSPLPDTSVIEEALGIFDIKPHGDDYDEIAFARRMRKKKRKPKRNV
jgi:hypothetical protein